MVRPIVVKISIKPAELKNKDISSIFAVNLSDEGLNNLSWKPEF